MTILHLMDGQRMHDARRLKGPVAFEEGMSAENSKSQTCWQSRHGQLQWETDTLMTQFDLVLCIFCHPRL